MIQDRQVPRKRVNLAALVRPPARVAAVAFLFLAGASLIDYIWGGKQRSLITFSVINFAICLLPGFVAFWIESRKPADGNLPDNILPPITIYCFLGIVAVCLIPVEFSTWQCGWHGLGFNLFYAGLIATGCGAMLGSLPVAMRNSAIRKRKIEEARRKRALEISEQWPK